MKVIGRRVIQLVVVFIVVTFFTVWLMSLVPGKPEIVVIPFDSPQQTQRKAFRHDNGLDKPLPVRWVKWADKFVHGDFGNYYSSTGRDPVKPHITASAPISALLILYTQIFSLLVAVPLAIWAAYKSGSRLDRLLNAGAFGCISLPAFAIVLTLTYYLGVQHHLLPASGYTHLTKHGKWTHLDLVDHFKSMVIPVIALSLGQIAVYMRLLRSDLVATLQEDFILMAKAKGISNARVLWRHALRPSSLTLLTVAGLSIGTAIGGTLVVEYLLGIPGMGYLIGQAVLARQYVALQSAVALIAIFFVLLNFLIDYLYNVLDPRIPGAGMTQANIPPATLEGTALRADPPADPAAEKDPAAPTAKKKRLPISAWFAIGWLTIITLAAILAPILPLHDPNTEVGEKRLAPFQSGAPILGTDANGRDMLSRTLYGGRVSLTIAVCAILVGILIGGFLGLIAGYFRTWLGNALVSVFDILLAIPQLVLALSLVSVLKGDPNQPQGFHIPIVIVLIIALGLVSIPILAGITRASTLTWSQRDFVTAARAQGAGNGRILFREVLPNVAPAMFSIALLGMAIAIVAEGGLAILGVSVEPPQATWGTMVADGKGELVHAGFILYIPMVAIFLSAVSLNYLGDVIRERFDVRESAL